MRQPQGYTIITGPDLGRGKEMDLFSCAHCGQVVFEEPRKKLDDLGGICWKCGSPDRPSFICQDCCGKECDFILKKIERWEKRGFVCE